MDVGYEDTWINLTRAMHMYRMYGSKVTHGAVTAEQFFARSSMGIFTPPSMAPCDIRPPRMVEVQILQEHISVRPSMGIKKAES
jgi:hypothetical protein